MKAIENIKCFPYGINNNGNVKVFCFHHAGGSSISFRDFVKIDNVNFIPVELPGRGTRIMEECARNIYSLVDELTKDIIKGIGDSKFILYGHSMGALIAFLVEYNLENKCNKKAEKIIVSGRQAPNYPDLSTFKVAMGKEALITELKRLGGTPKEVLDNKELMEVIIPIITSDYGMIETYRYNGEVINASIEAYSGSNDDEANVYIMKRWSEVTKNEFVIKEVEGDHFFVYDKQSDFLNLIIKSISRI